MWIGINALVLGDVSNIASLPQLLSPAADGVFMICMEMALEAPVSIPATFKQIQS